MARYYLVSVSFPGQLADHGFVVNTLKDASKGVQSIINDYRDGWQYIWEDGERRKNEYFLVVKERSLNNKRLLCGAQIRYSDHGVGVVVQVNRIAPQEAEGWTY
jgi:hypothetical protein